MTERYILHDGNGKEYICTRDQVVSILAACKQKGGHVTRHRGHGTIRQDFGSTLHASYFTVHIGNASGNIFKVI